MLLVEVNALVPQSTWQNCKRVKLTSPFQILRKISTMKMEIKSELFALVMVVERSHLNWQRKSVLCSTLTNASVSKSEWEVARESSL